MAENEIKQKAELENRSVLKLSGITGLDSFDEEKIDFEIGSTVLEITGEGLNVTRLALESGEAVVCGKINSVIYCDEIKKPSLFNRIFG